MPLPTSHIIIVNYNSGAWLQRSVQSALDHSAANVTVVDNCSVDQSMSDAQNFIDSDRVEWVYNKSNVGFAAANNQVLKSVETEFSILMNPDCELSDGALSRMFDAFDKYPEFGIASCRILNEDGSLQATCRRRFPTPWTALVRMLLLNRVFPNHPQFSDFDYGFEVDPSELPHSVEAISGAFMMVDNKALQDVGLMDEGYFMHCEDLDWCKRFARANWKVGFVPSAEVLHAKGVSTQSRPIGVLWTLHKGMNRFFDKFYRDVYAWPLRYLVKVGIVGSFCVRAGIGLIKILVNSVSAK